MIVFSTSHNSSIINLTGYFYKNKALFRQYAVKKKKLKEIKRGPFTPLGKKNKLFGSNVNLILTPLIRFRTIIASYYWQILKFYKLRVRTKFWTIPLSKRLKFLVPELKKIGKNTNHLRTKKFLRKCHFYFTMNRRFFRLGRLKIKEARAWKLYIWKLRVWYNIYRSLSAKNTHLFSARTQEITEVQKQKMSAYILFNRGRFTRGGRRSKFLLQDVNDCKLLKNELWYKIKEYWTQNRNNSEKKLNLSKFLANDTKPIKFEFMFNKLVVKKKRPWVSRLIYSVKEMSSLFKAGVYRRRRRFFRLRRKHSRRAVQNRRRKVENFLKYSHKRFHKFRLFYTTLSYKQFQVLFNKFQFFKKNAAGWLICILELRLEFFLYRINFAPSKYFAKQLILHQGVLINGRIVKNKNYQVKKKDILNISARHFQLVFNSLLNRIIFSRFSSLRRKEGLGSKLPLIFSNPDYLEVDYCLLMVSIIRLPFNWEIFVPRAVELDIKNKNLGYIYNSYL
jgi:ribosomal protein S4